MTTHPDSLQTMMNLPPSDSDHSDEHPAAASSSFEFLDETVRRWVWGEGWRSLRAIQELAIPILVGSDRDIIIAAPTAGGKTEAAFLPICSMLYRERAPGFGALYIGPLKALINDQFGRLEALCGRLETPVHRWHGDVSSARKRTLLQSPEGILLITPESIEALFALQGPRVEKLLKGVRFLVIDELHAYMDTERGRHLQSLLNRVERVAGPTVRRVGLSATLGDLEVAREFLRPGSPERVEIVSSGDSGGEVKLQVRGYVAPQGIPKASVPESTLAERLSPTEIAIARHLFQILRGDNHLIFANSRRLVERYADLMRALSEEARVPNEFFPHHGSLAKELREDLETRLRDSALPTSAICTSTLELGIDIGRVASVAQIGPPPSVSSLRQRLGRSGRRGQAAILRVYVSEPEQRSGQSVLDGLRANLVEAIAMVQLLIGKWYEPPAADALHLSTLTHQVLSLIAERGGVTAQVIWEILCEGGPFRSVSRSVFASLLRCLGEKDLIIQSPDGTLLHGGLGERIVNHFTFFAAFESSEEYRLVCDGRELGAMPLHHGLAEGMLIIFAGRRWKVCMVEADRKTIYVQPARGGRLPAFEGTRGAPVHDRVRIEMRKIYEGGDIPPYLTDTASELLCEARQNYLQLRLDSSVVVRDGNGSVLFLCRGDRILNTLAVQLATRGIRVQVAGPALLVDELHPDEMMSLLDNLRAWGAADALGLASKVSNKRREKFDWALSEELMNLEYAARDLDVDEAYRCVCEVSRGGAG